VESCGILHVREGNSRLIDAKYGRGIGDEIGFSRSGPQVHAKVLMRKRGQNHRRRIEVNEIRLECFGPAGHRPIEDRPRFRDVMALETDAAQLARGAVQPVASHHPPRVQLIRFTVTLDFRTHAAGVRFETGQARRTARFAALPVQVAGENGLRNFFGHAEIKSINAATGRQIHRPQHFAAGINPDASLFAPGFQKFFGQPQRFENLQRARMHHGGAIPVQGRRTRVNQVARHTTSFKFGGEQQTGRSRTNDQHRRRVVGHAGFTLRLRHI